MAATADALPLRAQAADQDSLQRIQDGIARRLETVGRRDQLRVTWQQPEARPSPPGEDASTAAHVAGTAPRRGHGKTIGLAVVGVLVLAVHLGLFGVTLGASGWGWGAGAILALLLMKVLFLSRSAKRQGRSHLAVHRGKGPEPSGNPR